MIPITDEQLARIWEAPRRQRPEPGVYSAPAALAAWDGTALKCTPTGLPLSPAAAIISPGLARAIQRTQPPSKPRPTEPTIAALEADYDAATAPLSAGHAAAIVPASMFRARLAACRACQLWDEPARAGRGRCQSTLCHCSKRLLWLRSEPCPAQKWP